MVGWKQIGVVGLPNNIATSLNNWLEPFDNRYPLRYLPVEQSLDPYPQQE